MVNKFITKGDLKEFACAILLHNLMCLMLHCSFYLAEITLAIEHLHSQRHHLQRPETGKYTTR